MSKNLPVSTDFIHSQLNSKQKQLVNDDTVVEIQKLSEDPDYGPEFLSSYIDHLNILNSNNRWDHDTYLNAIKFFSLVEAGNSLTDSYIKVFPERFEQRKKNHDDPKKEIMRGEASRYNKTNMVNEIRKVAAIPVQLIHRNLLHEAILEQADLMRNARSEMVRHKAADSLIRELKPAEDHVISVQVEDGAKSVIQELRETTERLAAQQHQSVQAGIPLKQINEAKIIEGEAVEVTDDGS